MRSILIIEDDPSVLSGVEESLRAENFKVLKAEDGVEGSRLARQEGVDLVILDLKLPDIRGEDVLSQLRKDGINVPVIVLSGKKKEMDKVLCLEMGADDYVTKPFSAQELCSRVRAVLRRQGDLKKVVEECSFGKIYVDFKKQEATRDGKEIKLSAKEFEVLKFFVEREGEVIPRDTLLNEVWGYEAFPTTRTVDNYILALRKKIEEEPSRPRHIVTVHTAGYKFLK